MSDGPAYKFLPFVSCCPCGAVFGSDPTACPVCGRPYGEAATPAPDSMVERVAKAIYYDRYPKGSNVSLCTWEQLSERGREGYRGDARAAIEALREPTADMKIEGQRSLLRCADNPDPSDAEHAWRAMIDAALS